MMIFVAKELISFVRLAKPNLRDMLGDELMVLRRKQGENTVGKRNLEGRLLFEFCHEKEF